MNAFAFALPVVALVSSLAFAEPPPAPLNPAQKADICRQALRNLNLEARLQTACLNQADFQANGTTKRGSPRVYFMAGGLLEDMMVVCDVAISRRSGRAYVFDCSIE